MNTLNRIIPVLAILLLATLPLLAQAEAPYYARIGSWKVERAHWADFEESAATIIKPILDRLFDQNTIMEYGMDTAGLHGGDGYTHDIWFSARSLANLEAAVDALNAMETRLSDADRARMMGGVTAHEDSLVRSLVFRSRAATLTDAFSGTTSEKVKPGQGAAYSEWYRTNLVPVWQELLDAGTVSAFGLDVEHIHSAGVRGRTSWYILPNAAALDALEAAFAEAFAGDKLIALLSRWAEIVETDEHSDSISRVLFYRVR